MRGALVGMMVAGALALGPTAAFGALQGPAYPVPDQNGGTTCASDPAADPDGAAGKGTGQTWTEGGGPTTAGTATCDPGGTVNPFDTSKFARLYWAIPSASPPALAL